MKLISKLLIISIFIVSLNAKEVININFKNLQIEDLIKITSKIINKNILMTENVKGTVDFISNKEVYKEDILNILMYVLAEKGYTIVDNNDILRIVKLNDSSQYNLPVLNKKNNNQYFQMITEIFNVKNTNVDYVSSKIRHLISKTAKLVTDKDTNSIILTDFPDNINTVKHVINLIAKDNQKQMIIVELKNIQATNATANLVNIAKSLYNEQVEKEKVSIIANKDDNSVIIIGKQSNIDYLAKYIRNIDEKGSLTEQSVEVIGLKNVESKNVLEVINSIIGKKTYIDPVQKPYASMDEESNSIVLMGPKDELSNLKILIKELDKDRLQVYVKAKIIEVSENRTKEVGIRYGLLGGGAGSDGLLAISSSLNNGSTLLDTVSDLVTIPDLTKGLALGATINLLNANDAADIVSEPSILCINNKESSIYVGNTVSIQTSSSVTDGGTTSNSYTREDIGLTLKVKPRISHKDKVILDISTILEDVSQATTNGQPNTSKKEVTTTAIVNNGESIILGGLIKNKKENAEDKIPLLGDIPLLGNLFKNNYDLNDKINLVIVITPYIIPKSKDLTYIREQLAELKIIEDKYTKEKMLELEKRRLNGFKDDLNRAKEYQELHKEKEDVIEDINNFESSTINQNEKIKKEYFGL